MTGPGLAARLFQLTFELYPHWATERGYEGFDDRLPPFGPEELDSFRSAFVALRAEVPATPPAGATLDEQVDWTLLGADLRAVTFHIDELDWLSTNPLFYIEALMACLGGLELRTDLGQRQCRDSLISRLGATDRFIAQMVAQVHEPMQPYSEMAIEMIEASTRYLSRRYARRKVGQGLYDSAQQACRALAQAQEHLLAQVDPRPFVPMGEARYRRLLRCEHLLTSPPGELTALGRRVLTRLKAEEAVAAADDATDDEQSAPTAPDDFGREQVLAYLNQELAEVRRFVEQRQIISLPPGELVLMETPEYLQLLIPSAGYHPPPVFGEGEATPTGYFFIRPIPTRMTRSQRDYYHTVTSRRQRRNLIVHEVYPGHHVQLLHALRQPSDVRKLRDNDVMVEGWAFYCEQLMVEQGLYAECPSPRPAAAERFRALRLVADVGIHTGRLSLEGAADLFCRHLGEEARPWVTEEVQRYAAEPSQALSYLVGREEILRLREEYRDRVGPRGFCLAEFHDRLLAEGSIPLPLIRCKLLDLPPQGGGWDDEPVGGGG